MSGHSPAPWTTEHGMVYSAEGHYVASCLDEDGEFCMPAEGPHDARLIAAAPDLLDVLKACADYLDLIPESAAGGDDEARRLSKAAFAVIARAAQP